MNILCTHPDKNCLWLNLVINVLRGTTYLKCLPIAISRKRASPTFCLHTQTAPMAAGIYPGPFAKEAQITTQMLLDSTPLPGLETVKKGLILELHEVLKSNLITWATFSQWVQMLFKSEQPKQWALRKSVTALSTRCSKMRKNYRYKSELDKLLNESYTLPKRHRSESTRPMEVTAAGSRCTVLSFDIETLTMTNQSLAAEVTGLKG